MLLSVLALKILAFVAVVSVLVAALDCSPAGQALTGLGATEFEVIVHQGRF